MGRRGARPLALAGSVSAVLVGRCFVVAGVYEGRLHSGSFLTGHSDPNRLRNVPPLIGAQVLNRLAINAGKEA